MFKTKFLYSLIIISIFTACSSGVKESDAEYLASLMCEATKTLDPTVYSEYAEEPLKSDLKLLAESIQIALKRPGMQEQMDMLIIKNSTIDCTTSIVLTKQDDGSFLYENIELKSNYVIYQIDGELKIRPITY